MGLCRNVGLMALCLTVCIAIFSPHTVQAQTPVAGQNLHLGIGTRALVYSSVSFPLEFGTDLRWIGVRWIQGNKIAGTGLSVTENPQIYVEGLTPIARILNASATVYLTTGATLVPFFSRGGWRLSNGWSMLPWIGLEADLFWWGALHVTAKMEMYITENWPLGGIGAGVLAHLYLF